MQRNISKLALFIFISILISISSMMLACDQFEDCDTTFMVQDFSSRMSSEGFARGTIFCIKGRLTGDNLEYLRTVYSELENDGCDPAEAGCGVDEDVQLTLQDINDSSITAFVYVSQEYFNARIVPIPDEANAEVTVKGFIPEDDTLDPNFYIIHIRY